MTKAEAVKAFLDQCYSDLGYHETGDNVNKFAEFLDAVPNFYNGPKNGYAWCDVFYDAEMCMTFGTETGRAMLRQPEKSAGAGCIYSRGYYEQAGAYYHEPELGDQAFFGAYGSEYHTGAVYEINGNKISIIEGNSGDRVQLCVYSLSSGAISGYGRPDWSQVANITLDGADGAEEPQEPAEGTQDAAADDGRDYCQVVLPVLEDGDTGRAVEVLQYALRAAGYAPSNSRLKNGAYDGEFGTGTYLALTAFQTDAQISACEFGKTGPETWAFLVNNF